MLPITINRKIRSTCQLGDIYKEYYFPTTLFGRSKAYYQDIHFLFNEFVNSFPKTLSPESFLLVFSQLFREHKFSYIYTITNTENAIDCFNILSGVIFDCFKHPNVSQDIFTPVEHILKEVHQHECLEMCEISYTFYRCFLLLLAFGLSNAQYNEEHFNLKGDQNKKKQWTVLPFNISKETLQCLSDLLETRISCLFFPQLPVIMYRLIFSKNPVRCRLCLYDGPNYYYQNRYGDPLSPFGLAKDIHEIYETTPPFLTLPRQELSKCLEHLEKLTHHVLQCVQSIPFSTSMSHLLSTLHHVADNSINDLCKNDDFQPLILAQNLVSLSSQLQALGSKLYSTTPLQENLPTNVGLKSLLNPQCSSSSPFNPQQFLLCLQKTKRRIHTFSKPSWRNPSGLQRPVLSDLKTTETTKILQNASQLNVTPKSFDSNHENQGSSLQLTPFIEASHEKQDDHDLNLEDDLFPALQNEGNPLFH